MLIAGTIGTSTWCFARGVDSEFRWAVITDVGNAPYTSSGIGGPRGGLVYPFAEGRGSVDYVYRISTLEVTTTQWMEFLNAIAPLQSTALTWGRPSHWGAEDDPSQPSGNYRLRSDVPNAGMIPVHAVSWRHAAMYVNWLCNDKQAALSAIANGAYDISTFGENPDGTITDQLTHHPDAKYWIPTYDEWIKAAHYDPNKDGEGHGGWWRFMYSQDTALTYGWPGEGQSAGGGDRRAAAGVSAGHGPAARLVRRVHIGVGLAGHVRGRDGMDGRDADRAQPTHPRQPGVRGEPGLAHSRQY